MAALPRKYQSTENTHVFEHKRLQHHLWALEVLRQLKVLLDGGHALVVIRLCALLQDAIEIVHTLKDHDAIRTEQLTDDRTTPVHWDRPRQECVDDLLREVIVIHGILDHHGKHVASERCFFVLNWIVSVPKDVQLGPMSLGDVVAQRVADGFIFCRRYE